MHLSNIITSHRLLNRQEPCLKPKTEMNFKISWLQHSRICLPGLQMHLSKGTRHPSRRRQQSSGLLEARARALLLRKLRTRVRLLRPQSRAPNPLMSPAPLPAQTSRSCRSVNHPLCTPAPIPCMHSLPVTHPMREDCLCGQHTAHALCGSMPSMFRQSLCQCS